MTKNLYTPEFLIQIANKSFSCDVLKKSRQRENVYGRMAVVHYLRNERGMTMKEIGDVLDKDHSTIIHYINEHVNCLQYDKIYKEKFEGFELELKRGFNVKSYAMHVCRQKIQEINNDLADLGFSFPEIESFWHKCINEVME